MLFPLLHINVTAVMIRLQMQASVLLIELATKSSSCSLLCGSLFGSVGYASRGVRVKIFLNNHPRLRRLH